MRCDVWNLPKGWTQLTTTYPREFNGAPYEVRTPSAVGFDRRFSIVDPFQKPYLAGHDTCDLSYVSQTIDYYIRGRGE